MCQDDHPLNRHLHCDLGNKCYSRIEFKDELCIEEEGRVFDRENCYTIREWHNECVDCAANAGLYCIRNNRCYTLTAEKEFL